MHKTQSNERNSLPHNKNVALSKWKAFTDNNIYVDQMIGLSLIFDRKKTLWDKEKMLVTIISSFTHNVFKQLLLRFVKTQHCVAKILSTQESLKLLFLLVSKT